MFVELLPVPKENEINLDSLSKLKNENLSSQELNKLVYEIYKLTVEEVNFIESQ